MQRYFNKLDLRQLRHFLAVVQTGSFSVAAEELRLTQPALSKSIRTLEQTLEVRLLDRGPNGIKLTLYGQRLLSYAELLLSVADEAVDELDALRGARRGSLRVGGMAAALRILLPPALNTFYADHPDVRIVVYEGLSEYLLPQLFAGKLDVLFTVRPGETLKDELVWRHISTAPVSIVAHESHPLVGHETVSLTDLSDFKWILPPPPEPDRLTLEKILRSAGQPKPQVLVETTSTSFLAAMLASGPYLSYMPHSSIASTGMGLTALPTPDIALQRDIYAVFRRKGELRPLVSSLLRLISGGEAESDPSPGPSWRLK